MLKNKNLLEQKPSDGFLDIKISILKAFLLVYKTEWFIYR